MVLVSWTTFDFFRPVLIDAIDIPKFKSIDKSRWECTIGDSMRREWAGGGHLFFSEKHF